MQGGLRLDWLSKPLDSATELVQYVNTATGAVCWGRISINAFPAAVKTRMVRFPAALSLTKLGPTPACETVVDLQAAAQCSLHNSAHQRPATAASTSSDEF